MQYLCIQRKDPLMFHWLKRKITNLGNFTITMSGPFLPTQLIYEGTTFRCLPKDVEFPTGFDATCTVNQLSKESEAIQHLEEILLQFFEKLIVRS